MLDTIAFIPTILAYAFIGLLVVILCFIVVYISHKIYNSVYDCLPLPYNMVSSLLDSQEQIASSKSRKSAVVFVKNENSYNRRYKTALRFIVSLEQCYLAYVVFETEKLAVVQPDMLLVDPSFSDFRKHTQLIKYFDRLSMIPMGRVMQRCDNADLHNNPDAHYIPSVETAAQTDTPILATEVTPTTSPLNLIISKNTTAVGSSTAQVNRATTTTVGRPTATFATALNALAQTGTRPARPPPSP